VLEPRRRQLARWLQYVCSHSALQGCPLLQAFITGTTSLSRQRSEEARPLSRIQAEVLSSITDEEAAEDEGDKGAGSRLAGLPDGYSRHKREIARKELVTISRCTIRVHFFIFTFFNACMCVEILCSSSHKLARLLQHAPIC